MGSLTPPQNLQVLLLLFITYFEKSWHNQWLISDKTQLQISVKHLKFSIEFDFKTLNSKMVRRWNTLSKYLSLLPQ